MQALHIVLLATTALAFFAAAAPGSRVGSGSEHGRLITLVVSGAVVVGNAASLMPGTPGWYARAMIVLTFGVVAWALVSLTARGARGARRETVVLQVRREATRRGPAGGGPRVIHQPQARRVVVEPTSAPETGRAQGRGHLYLVRDTEIIDAEIVEGETPQGNAEPVASARIATQATFDAAGPRGAGRVRGETYVAAHLGDYLPERKQELVHRRSRARHAGNVDLRTRLNRVYGIDEAATSVASFRA